MPTSEPHRPVRYRSSSGSSLVEVEVERTQEDVEARRLRSSLQARLFGAQRKPICIGKYVLGEPLGEGGMGTVYRAYDPDLDRRVALKVVRRRGQGVSDENAQRLIREARALAKLGHPNVVAVHDAGIADRSPYLVMELVEGSDLGAWCEANEDSGRRRTQSLLGFLVAVGEGLARAHGEGLVHRDIKPSNIFVGDDGRPRLGDFGLAAIGSVLEPESVELEARTDPGLGGSSSASALTQAGAFLGTPAYTAPEQWEGRADARSDQFSLCATFYEALCGVRPFAGTTLSALQVQIERGAVQPPRIRVARGVRRVLLRGLSVQPERRHPSVAALLAALRRTRRRRVLVPVIGMAVAGAVGVQQGLAEGPDPCAQAPAAIASAWNESLRESVRERFFATELTFAEPTWERVDAHMSLLRDRVDTQWSEACVAARVQGMEPPGPHAACLERMAATLHFAAERLAEIEAHELERAVPLVKGLGQLRSCATVVALPQQWEDAAALEQLEQFERGRVSYHLGRYEDAQARFEDVLARTEHGALPGLRSLAHALMARHWNSSDPARAREHAQASLDDAMHAQAPELIANAWLELAMNPEAEDGFTEFCLDRAAALEVDAPGEVEARGAFHRAELLARQERDADARPWFQRAIELYEQEPDKAGALSAAKISYAQSLVFSGRLDEGVEEGREGIAIGMRELGPGHPGVGEHQLVLGNTLLVAGRHAEGLAALDAGIEIMMGAPEVMSRVLAQAYGTRAGAHLLLGNLEAALADARRAVERTREAFGPRHVAVAVARNRVAEVLRDLGRVERAIDELRTALDEHADGLGKHPELEGSLRITLAESLVLSERSDEAVAEVDQVIALRAGVHAQGSTPGLKHKGVVGQLLSRAGRHERAIPWLSAAREEARAADVPYWEGRLTFELAQAHHRFGQHDAAVREARAARVLLGDHDDLRAELEALDRIEREGLDASPPSG